MTNESFLEQVCRSAVCYKTYFYFIVACADALRLLLFVFEVTFSRESSFTHVCRASWTVKSYHWYLWMLLFIHEWVAMVGAISNVALQDPGAPLEGVFLLSHVLCELPGIGVGAGLSLCHTVCNYMPNRQKLNFSLRKTLAPRIKHNPFSCCNSVFFII